MHEPIKKRLDIKTKTKKVVTYSFPIQRFIQRNDWPDSDW